MRGVKTNILTWLMSGFLAGIFIGLGGMAFLLSPSKLIGACIFPLGLYFICRCGLDLYTGKIGFVFANKDITPLRLSMMLIGNLIGAFLFGLLIRGFGVQSVQTVSKAFDVAGAFIGFGKSVLCGMLVCLAVHLYIKGKTDVGQFISVFAPIFLFVLCSFEHCIADMFYFGFTLKLDTLWAALVAIIGNTLGAWLFVVMYTIANRTIVNVNNN